MIFSLGRATVASNPLDQDAAGSHTADVFGPAVARAGITADQVLCGMAGT